MKISIISSTFTPNCQRTSNVKALRFPCRQLFYLSLTALFVVVFFMRQALAAPSYDSTWQYPVMPIPLLEKAPTLDGTIDVAEWSQATLFPALTSMDPGRRDGLPPRERTWVWMGYTSDPPSPELRRTGALYVAWRQDLPQEERPVKASATKRDGGEGSDNTVVLSFAIPEAAIKSFQISGNARSNLWDRRLDNLHEGLHWNPAVEYKSRETSQGWEGELKLPFTELGLKSAPSDGTRWSCYIYSSWRKISTRIFAWPYVGWRQSGETGMIVFGGKNSALRFEGDGIVRWVGGQGKIETELWHRRERLLQSYNVQVKSAVQASKMEGGTFESFEKIVGDALKGFEVASKVADPGEYLLRYVVENEKGIFTSGIQPIYKAAPVELEVSPFFLRFQKLLIEALTELETARSVEITIHPGGKKESSSFVAHKATVEYPIAEMKEGKYEVVAEAKDAEGRVIAKATETVFRSAAPDWWTMKEGFEPLIPPPWTPVEVTGNRVQVLGRKYEFGNQAVPSQIETRGQKILAGPMEFKTSQPWKTQRSEFTQKKSDAVVYESENISGNLIMKGRTQVEFDGFMYVDLDLSGGGSVDKLDLVIPFKKEHAVLLQNYIKASGPGDGSLKTNNLGGRQVGLIPVGGYRSPPMITTWIGTDRYGLEWSCESSRGWAMAKPNEAMEVTHEGDQVLLTIHLISKPVKLSDQPRHIRFGLVATPTKTLLPYLQKARIYDNISPALSPGDWAGYPHWHPPLKDAKVIAKTKKRIEDAHQAGAKVLVNGGWNVSCQAPDWEVCGREMIIEPIRNVSFGQSKQYAGCWKTPFADFMVNSFGYNAKLSGLDGIRFDTVVPSYECASLVHGCGWYDDDGKLWPSFSIFSQREAWKRLYRIFHGGVIKEGAIYTPKAAAPIMAVDSFSDITELGEGFYQNASNIKDGYPSDIVRAMMADAPYGARCQNNLKNVHGGQLFTNERIAALLVNGADPRLASGHNAWKVGYEAQAMPAVSIWDAWDWVDRWNAEWLGHWENSEFLKLSPQTTVHSPQQAELSPSTSAEASTGKQSIVDSKSSTVDHRPSTMDYVQVRGQKVEGRMQNEESKNQGAEPESQKPKAKSKEPMILASFWLQKGKKALLVVTNYEKEPMDGVEVNLDLEKCGLKGSIFAEDAITMEPVPISENGALKLNILGQRYRLIKISQELPRYREEALSPNLIDNAPGELTDKWTSSEIKLEPNSIYVLEAQLKIDQSFGMRSANPNQPASCPHFVSISLDGAGINGINGTNKLALCKMSQKGNNQSEAASLVPYQETNEYRQSYIPRMWEKTPGWMRMFLPVSTGANTSSGRFVVQCTDPGQVQVKNLSLRKVKH